MRDNVAFRYTDPDETGQQKHVTGFSEQGRDIYMGQLEIYIERRN